MRSKVIHVFGSSAGVVVKDMTRQLRSAERALAVAKARKDDKLASQLTREIARLKGEV